MDGELKEGELFDQRFVHLVDMDGKIVELVVPPYDEEFFSQDWSGLVKDFLSDRTRINICQSRLRDENGALNDSNNILSFKSGGVKYELDTDKSTKLKLVFIPEDPSDEGPAISLDGASKRGMKDQPVEEMEIEWRIIIEDEKIADTPGGVFKRRIDSFIKSKERIEKRSLEIPRNNLDWGDPSLNKTGVIEVTATNWGRPDRYDLDIGTTGAGKGGISASLLKYNVVDSKPGYYNVAAYMPEPLLYPQARKPKNFMSDYMENKRDSLARALLFNLSPSLIGKPVKDVTQEERQRRLAQRKKPVN